MNIYEIDEYTLQSYFKLLCSGAAIARKQTARLCKSMDELKAKENEKEAIGLSIENSFWDVRKRRIKYEILATIDEMKKRNFSIIVTNEEEVLVLMEYYAENPLETYHILNIGKLYLEVFPKSEMCKEFLHAYYEMIIADIAGTDSGIEQMAEVIKKYL